MRLWNGMLGESGHIADHLLGRDKTSYFPLARTFILFSTPKRQERKKSQFYETAQLEYQ